MATIEAASAEVEPFVRWLNDVDDFAVDIAVKKEHGDWFALVLQFDITGTGATRHEAITEVLHLLFAYLRAYFDDGAEFAAALRPVPRSLRLRIEAETAVARLGRHVSARAPFATEDTYALPPGTLANFAPC
jgi:hypothetical protein